MHPLKFKIIKKKLKKAGTLFLRHKIKTVPAFRHRQVSSPHHHETHFYTIYTILERNHTNHNHLYSSPSNYTYP